MSADMISYLRTVTIDPDSVRAESDGRTITGQAVPYGVDQAIPGEGIVERFARGAFAHQLPALHRVPLTYRHQSQGGEVIGRLASGVENDRGLQVEMRVSDTTLGRDVATLVRDGAIRELSIGFRSNSKGSRRVEGGVTERTRANLFEVALLPEGAYGRHATVTGIRSMDDLLRAAQVVDELDDEADQERGMELADALAALHSIPLPSSRALAR